MRYTTVPGRLPAVFEIIRNKGIPKKADKEWLASMGMAASNDRTVLSVLEQLGFVDAAGVPTALWRTYRGPDAESALASAIRQAYRELYEAFPQAHKEPGVSLTQWVKSVKGFSEGTAQKFYQTFSGLCELAAFDEESVAERAIVVEPETGSEPQLNNDIAARASDGQKPLVVNVNLQITLPTSDDPRVYDSIFESMRKHLLANERYR